MHKKRLMVGHFPTPFDGEVAYFELGLHRVTRPAPAGWEVETTTLGRATVEARADQLLAPAPAVILLHVYRDRVPEALRLAAALGERAPEVPLVWCGWTAHAPYVSAVASALEPVGHPRLFLACGEVEAAVPPLLDALGGGSVDPAAVVAALPSSAWFDVAAGTWRGEGQFAQVADVTTLSPVWSGPEPASPHAGGAGWIELSRGCKYACSFCVACAMGEGRVRSHAPERIAEEIAAAARRGVRLFGLLAAATNYDVESLRAVAGAVRDLGAVDLRVAGTVHAKYAHGERLELMAGLRWETMIVGLQTTTAGAQQAMRRREDRDVFAAAIDRLGAFGLPEVELILGLPGDTLEGFQASVGYALSLHANVSVYRLRLDPWSRYLEAREPLGVVADFANAGRVASLPGFDAPALAEAERWLAALGREPWRHRARRLLYDGREIHPPRR